MILRPWERDYYVQVLVLDPPITGTWEASFDGGTTWKDGTNLGPRTVEVDGEEVEADAWGWLVAGEEFDATAVGLNPADTQAVITESMKPRLRLKDSPIMDGEVGSKIRVKAS